jgi:hypothetical protein
MTATVLLQPLTAASAQLGHEWSLFAAMHVGFLGAMVW